MKKINYLVPLLLFSSTIYAQESNNLREISQFEQTELRQEKTIESSISLKTQDEQDEAEDLKYQLNTVYDPLEPINRKVYSFNKNLDTAILKPASIIYDKVTPNLIQTGVTNFFNYIKSPLNIVNYALQGNKVELGHSMGRLLINTFGFGVFDIASEASIPLNNTSFGDTLGVWGVSQGPYIVLPLLGGANLRDTAANLALDIPLSPISNLSNNERLATYSLDTVNTRKNLGNTISIIEGASLDEYNFVRDATELRRANKIEGLKIKN